MGNKRDNLKQFENFIKDANLQTQDYSSDLIQSRIFNKIVKNKTFGTGWLSAWAIRAAIVIVILLALPLYNSFERYQRIRYIDETLRALEEENINLEFLNNELNQEFQYFDYQK